MNNLLLVRTDRLGDVILSTPAATALKKRFANCRVTFLARRDTLPVLECHPHVDEIVAIDQAQYAGGRGFFQLAKTLRQKKFDAAVLLHPSCFLASLTVLATIPRRLGTGYRFYSHLFTDRIFEHRKTAQRHEAEYNLRLLHPLGVEEANAEFHYRLRQQERAQSIAKLAALGVPLDAAPVILHPGSGGSARDWPPSHFAALADALRRDAGRRVIFTGVAREGELIESIIARMQTKPINLAGCLTLKDFIVLLERAAIFVSNSTGPLHLAVMVGAQVVAFYPPIRVCRPERWGPYGRRADVLMSQAEECFRCRDSGERYCPCMAAITVEQALSKIREKLLTPPLAVKT